MNRLFSYKYILPVLICPLFIGISGCVTSKKYKKLEKVNATSENENKALRSDTASLHAQVNLLADSVRVLNLLVEEMSKKSVEKTESSGPEKSYKPVKKRTISEEKEYKNKAFFIFSFTRYIEWPMKTLEDFTIGVIGSSPITEKLRSELADKKVGSRNIRIKEFSSAKGIEECHIVFVPAKSYGQLAGAVSRGNKSSILVITEADGALESGSHINFSVQGDDVFFSVNKNGMKQAKLKVSSSLLNLAK
jgi:hypothetical protein